MKRRAHAARHSHQQPREAGAVRIVVGRENPLSGRRNKRAFGRHARAFWPAAAFRFPDLGVFFVVVMASTSTHRANVPRRGYHLNERQQNNGRTRQRMKSRRRGRTKGFIPPRVPSHGLCASYHSCEINHRKSANHSQAEPQRSVCRASPNFSRLKISGNLQIAGFCGPLLA